jgi:outer membrane receptor protein involved in Fe transport
VSASYGQSENVASDTGYLITNKVEEALLATNTTTCLSGNAACVPLNVFGPTGSITPAMSRFIEAASSTRRTASLTQVRGLLSGDLGVGFGDAEPISFAVGAEYRDYGAAVLPDDIAERGALGGGGGPTPRIEGGYNVKEVYGEVIAPILEGKPFFENLTVEGGARYSSYEIAAPGNPSFDTFTWKAGATWEMVQGFKVRGNYSRAVRAPNIGELFSPVSRGLTNLGTDPCAGSAPASNANLRAVCIAQGARAGDIGFIEQPAAGQANAYGGGNPNVQPEKASTWTLGAVFQPTFAPGLALTVDYYNIGVTDAVSSPLPGDSIAACFANITAASASSPACLAIVRNPDSGSFDYTLEGVRWRFDLTTLKAARVVEAPGEPAPAGPAAQPAAAAPGGLVLARGRGREASARCSGDGPPSGYAFVYGLWSMAGSAAIAIARVREDSCGK